MLPKGWKRLSLATVAEVRTGVAKGKQNLKNPVELPYLRVANVQDGYIDTSTIKTIQIERDQIERYSLKAGDVLMTEGGDFDKLGRGDVWNGEINPCLHQNHVFAVRTDLSILTPHFLAALSASRYGKAYFLGCAKRSTNLASINSTQLKEFPVLLPPVVEQQKITKILSTWDQAISTTEKLLANSQQQKNALIQQLLSGKKRIPGFNDPWAKYKFSDLLYEIKNDVVNNPKDYELLSVKLHCKGVVRTGKYPAVTEGSRPYFIRHEGELIIGRQNLHNGGIGIVPKEVGGCIASNAISSFDVHENVSKSFMLHIMSRPLFFTQIDNLIGGTGQKEISVNELLKLKINIPSFEEQQRIARILTTSDHEIATLQQKLTCLKQEKKALMQQLLTGKRRVKVDAS
ncbi:MAG: restriction endonuclease subunit S [Methylococcaceae bacterium]|nr:restriction endonuclease subunit S [Methylococcaceae bacterium]